MPFKRTGIDTSAKNAQKRIDVQAKKTEAEALKPIVPAIQSQARPTRDVSSEEDDSSSEEDSSAQVQASDSTVAPVFYSARDNDENSSSSEESSEEETTNQAPTAQGSQQQTLSSKTARAVAENNATETGSTETVVYITPEAKKLPVD